MTNDKSNNVHPKQCAQKLAALGRQRDTAELLTTCADDRTASWFERLRSVEALGTLGTRYRQSAAHRMLALADETAIRARKWFVARALIALGPAFHKDAAGVLHAVLDSSTTDTNERLWAAHTLASLSPEHHAAVAQELRSIIDHPLADDWERPLALGRLAALGGEHRDSARAVLRADLADHRLSCDVRVRTAKELLSLGTDCHPEAVAALHDIATTTYAFKSRISAWRQLTNVGSRQQEAYASLLDLMGLRDADMAQLDDERLPQFSRADACDVERAAECFRGTLRQVEPNHRAYTIALHGLVELGDRFHGEAARDAIAYLRADRVHHTELAHWVHSLRELAGPTKLDLARTIEETLPTDRLSSEQIWNAHDAMTNLGSSAQPLLLTVVQDRSTRPITRFRAAIALTDPTTIQNLLPEDIDSTHWHDRASQTAALGVDVIAALRSAVEHPDVRQSASDSARVALAALNADAHTDDTPPLEDWTTILIDGRQPVSNRCVAAAKVLATDKNQAHLTLSLIGRFLRDDLYTAAERAHVYQSFVYLQRRQAANVLVTSQSLFDDPTTRGVDRSQLVSGLPGVACREAQRTLLVDRTLPVAHRIPTADIWGEVPLRTDVVEVLRNLFAAPEAAKSERIDAASQLADLSTRYVEEAAAALDDIGGFDARWAQAKMGLFWRRQILADSLADFQRAEAPREVKEDAGWMLWHLAPEVPDEVVEWLRDKAKDPGTADQERVRVLFELRHRDGLAGVRAMRDDETRAFAVRWKAAVMMRDRADDDQVAGVRVLARIAAEGRPALRWRAGQELMWFGDEGRERGAEALLRIVEDVELPRVVRAQAARVMAHERPDTRARMVRVLDDLAETDDRCARRRVLEAVSEYRPYETAVALRELAEDPDNSAIERVRCAEAMAATHRGYREAAAMVVREVAWDDVVARHIRVRAARGLARWSDLCLREARRLITELREGARAVS